jgi:hypothetical protein
VLWFFSLVFDQLIGKWVYEGPLPESVPGFAEKDSKLVLQASYAWILDKNAVEEVYSIEFGGGAKISGKGLTGWDAAGQRIVGGGMDSIGGYGLSTTTYDPATKTWTSKGEGTDGEGKANTSTIVMTLTDPDTLVWQATERTGGLVQGESPKYTFKRGPAGKRPAAVQQSDAAEKPAPAKKSPGDAKSEPAKKAEAVK